MYNTWRESKGGGGQRPFGLYHPSMERDACGVGFIVSIDGKASAKILRDSEVLCRRMIHRGARGGDNDTGDGAGVLTALPESFYAKKVKELHGIDLPAVGQYATGLLFMSETCKDAAMKHFEEIATRNGLKVICWRPVPGNSSCLGKVARGAEPHIEQVFVEGPYDADELQKKMFMLRKQATHQVPETDENFYICSLSTSIVVYKGLFTSEQLWDYFTDLKDPEYETYLALVHTRFSTNTFPSWERAHPLRYLAHNGEINTLRGNVNLMKAREGVMHSSQFGDDLKSLYPVVEPNLSDSGCVDCVLEFLVMAGGRSLPEAVMTMVPEAWQNDEIMNEEKKDFYRWAACAMEPWDGPALLTFTDGRYVGAILDRNGLRPSRYYITSDNIMVMASEVGVYDCPHDNIIQKGRLKPGRMLLVDTKEKVVTRDEELKLQIARSRPHSEWLKEQITLNSLREAHAPQKPSGTVRIVVPNQRSMEEEPKWQREPSSRTFDRRLPMFGYTTETIAMLLIPMVTTKKEALGSMGNDAPLACLSDFQPLSYDYFKQLFAQVTNPPIDPFRERVVMSLSCPIGPCANILEPSAEQCKRLFLENPILSLEDLYLLRKTTLHGWKKPMSIDMTYPLEEGPEGLVQCLDRVCKEACEAAAMNYQFLILSDRMAGPQRVAVSALLVLGAVHHRLIEDRQRMKVALVLETGEAREVHQMCVLLGFGADAICPYLVFETMETLREEGVLESQYTDQRIYQNFCSAMERGIAKVMAKMGISTLQSYKGAQIFEAVGISEDVVNRCFKGAPSRIGGVTFDVFARDALDRHYIAYDTSQCDTYVLRNPGLYHWRSGGEKHINDPEAIGNLQNAVRNKVHSAYEKYRDITFDNLKKCTIRGQLEFVDCTTPVPISEVEPASEIVKRFATGAMSFGSISLEAHTTLAVAMNRVGGKSNTGEGGEDSDRFIIDDPEFNRRSAIKQVASGRFGVTINYLSNSDELQIKMAQGAKPGEGGELPGYKVTEDIAKTRHSVPGVGLISPPPHHDIYSIEDLAELIYDLKCANPKARISVKLVSEVGVGVVASGVAKGKAEHITISGHDGGTGASSWTGIKHSGLPWELGISETHQVLVMNDLRSRVVLQADGQMRTGFDIVVGALLGADEFGMSTAPLIVMGCTMMRKCHLNTCPVGVATQDPVLRKKFEGKPEHVINFLFMLAEEARGYMAKLGIRKFKDLIGRTDLLKVRSDVSERVKMLNFSTILENANNAWPHINILGGSIKQDFSLGERLDVELIKQSMPVLQKREKTVTIEMTIHNECRTFGATLSNEIANRYGDAGLPDQSININLKGSAGQSFCAFLARGVRVTLEGDANDYVGKCLSGGEVILYPPSELPPQFETHKNIIAGNVCLYGATSGKAYFRGMVAERFCVRNSGAIAVCEGCGDHGCEYMTGGHALILGLTGRNFAAGMSGGIAYVWDVDGSFRSKCNMSMVELHPLEELDDLEWVESLLQDFYDKTGSVLAKGLLQDWPDASNQFLKVFPLEYQRALKQIAEKKCTLRLQAGGGTDSAPGSTLPSPYGEEKTPIKTAPKPILEPAVADIEDAIKGGQKKKILDKPRGFMKYRRETEPYRDAAERQEDWNEIYNFTHVRSGLRKQAARCMECGVPFCQSSNGCPLGNVIPKWNDLVFNNDWKEALDTLLQTNNFPEFTGRVCPAPCEGACVLGINEPAVTIKNIECSIIDYGFEQGWLIAQPPATRSGKSVAVVGGGPSGMACAHQLNKAGHLVTVYERNDRIGGLLQYGIPTMKLGKDVVQRRVKLLEEEGIIFKTSSYIGKDISAKELKEQNDAIVLCLGSTWPRDLPIPGRQLGGIHFAMEFLETWQKNQMGNDIDFMRINAKDKDVVVVGGGDTGCDCIATSLRQGAKSITTFEILPPPPPSRATDNPWPQWPKIFRVDYGHEEVKVKWGNDPRMFNTLSKEFLDDGNGHVTGIKTVEVSWAKDPSGRWQMKELPDTEKIIKADLVLLAMGFLGPEKDIIKELLLQQDPRSNIQTPQGKYCTSVQGVFAAGDCRRGQSLVVWAITEGRQAAREVDVYLNGKSRLSATAGIIQYGHFPAAKG